MKYFIPAFVLTICGFSSFGQTQYNQIAATGAVGLGTLAPSSTYNLHIARKATNVFTPLLMLEDSITNGFSQMGFKGTS